MLLNANRNGTHSLFASDHQDFGLGILGARRFDRMAFSVR